METKTIKSVIGDDFFKLKTKAQNTIIKAEKKVRKMYADYLLKNFSGRHFRHLVSPNAPELVFVTVKEINGWAEAVMVDTKEKEEYTVSADALFTYYELID